ncbi:Uma2 family endonuclease [Hamadaea flava]|uniref:Uma2 family endonuclease n=1 Tax=Hamadaea flava TaxID=1742688 RepID=A0ABV8LL84_9ACTN|nr:Uma2 family endonuclease [Hamadaea flava]
MLRDVSGRTLVVTVQTRAELRIVGQMTMRYPALIAKRKVLMTSPENEEQPMTAVADTRPSYLDRTEWTVDDLQDLPENLNYELVNGRLILPSPTFTHQEIAIRVKLALDEHCPQTHVVSTDQSIAIDNENEPRPDVVVIPVEHIDVSPVPVAGSLLAVEIVSASQSFREMADKATAYAIANIPHYWIIDSQEEQLYLAEMALDSQTGEYRRIGATTGVFKTEQPYPVTIDLPALSTRYAKLRARAGR